MHSLKYKIILLTLIPLTLVLLIIGSLSVYNKSENESKLLLERLNSYRYLLESGDLTFETSADKNKLKALIGEKIVFSEIIRDDYTVIYSSENSSTPLFTQEEKSDIDEAFHGVETIREGDMHGEQLLCVISPIVVNGRVVAVIHQGISNEDSSYRVLTFTLFILIINIAGILIIFVSVFALLNTVVLKNIFKLKESSLEIQKGNLDVKNDIVSKDEIGQLAIVFNEMTTKLKESYTVLEVKIKERTRELEEERGSLEEKVKERTKELEDLKNGLELMVEERTKKLNDKLEELERINKLMINRELKMIELKKEIDSLKNNKIIS